VVLRQSAGGRLSSGQPSSRRHAVSRQNPKIPGVLVSPAQHLVLRRFLSPVAIAITLFSPLPRELAVDYRLRHCSTRVSSLAPSTPRHTRCSSSAQLRFVPFKYSECSCIFDIVAQGPRRAGCSRLQALNRIPLSLLSLYSLSSSSLSLPLSC
jgi:hypothetical protein